MRKLWNVQNANLHALLCDLRILLRVLFCHFLFALFSAKFYNTMFLYLYVTEKHNIPDIILVYT